jgi:hypothetical protein
VWLLSRDLEPVESWFSPSSIWSEPNILSLKSEKPVKMTHFASAADDAGNVHVMWAQSSAGNTSWPDWKIKYSRWSGNQWSTPDDIFKSLNGLPVHLSLLADGLDRVLVTWVDRSHGDLVFSWANSEKANLPSEWMDINGLPSPSYLVDTPDGVVDASGRIVMAYAVPLNEGRGIYIIQSTDDGNNWSEPLLVFDAVSADWERIEEPKLSLGKDGTLHLLFIRRSIREEQPVGLYYSRSIDGGKTWDTSQILSEGNIQWADIVSYGDRTVHAAWQEDDGLVFANVSQVSEDGGLTWGKQNDVTGVNTGATQVALTSDGHGVVHFIQLLEKETGFMIGQKIFTLEDWKWDGQNWGLDLAKDFAVKGTDVSYLVSPEITSTGFLDVFIPVEYTDQTGELVSEVLAFNRHLSEEVNNPLQIAVIPTLPSESGEENSPAAVETPNADFSSLYEDNVSVSPLQRNAVGLVLIGVGLVIAIILILWRRPTKGNR